MTLLIKLFISILLFVCLLVGMIRASPRYNTPGIPRGIDATVGAIFFVGGLLGLYFLWFHI